MCVTLHTDMCTTPPCKNEVVLPWNTKYALCIYHDDTSKVVHRASRRVMREWEEADGYKKVNVGPEQWRKCRVVLFALVGPPPFENWTAHHLNMDRSDDRTANLIWASPSQQAREQKPRTPYRREDLRNTNLSGEEWRDVPSEHTADVAGFKISATGKVRWPDGRVTAGTMSSGLYRILRVSGKHLRVHRLVAFAFDLPRRPDQNIVDHKNRNKLDNRVENLQWANSSENGLNAIQPGCKAVRQLREAKIVETFTSIGIAARHVMALDVKERHLSLIKANIQHVLSGRCDSFDGEVWEFVNEVDRARAVAARQERHANALPPRVVQTHFPSGADIKPFASADVASDQTGCSKRMIQRCCIGERQSSTDKDGHVCGWRFEDSNYKHRSGKSTRAIQIDLLYLDSLQPVLDHKGSPYKWSSQSAVLKDSAFQSLSRVSFSGSAALCRAIQKSTPLYSVWGNVILRKSE